MTRVRAKATTVLVALTDPATGELATGLTLATGDVKISKDGAAAVNAANLPTETQVAGVYSLPIDASEMECASLLVAVVDQTSPAAFDSVALELRTDTGIDPDSIAAIFRRTCCKVVVDSDAMTLSVYDESDTLVGVATLTDSDGVTTVGRIQAPT